jgi:exosortase
LPYHAEVALGDPLQRLATQASAYLLEVLGFCASPEGNTIVLNSRTLNVEEACSGLGMLVTFFALSVAVALVVQRPLLDRLVIVASAIPVSLVVNVMRIVATGIVAETVGGRAVHVVFHDVAGYLMMTLAAVLIWLELKVLARLLVAAPAPVDQRIDFTLGVVTPSACGKRREQVSVGK